VLVNVRAIESVLRDGNGGPAVRLKNRPETLAVSEPHHHLFRQMSAEERTATMTKDMHCLLHAGFPQLRDALTLLARSAQASERRGTGRRKGRTAELSRHIENDKRSRVHRAAGAKACGVGKHSHPTTPSR
jgi:hypothetical protein